MGHFVQLTLIQMEFFMFSAIVTGPADTCINWEASTEPGFQPLDLTKLGIKMKCFDKAVSRKKSTLKIKPKPNKGFKGVVNRFPFSYFQSC